MTASSRSLRALIALLFALLSLSVAVGNASAAPRNHTRHHRHHVPRKIGPGGDEDSDNHGAPSDGDGGI
jgi:hypothetical protein